jgi:hypothetical protein
VGIWDHIYRGGVQAAVFPEADDAKTVLAWCGRPVKTFATPRPPWLCVRRVPDLDAIQFRMHDESGLKKGEQEGFWRDVFQMMKQA